MSITCQKDYQITVAGVPASNLYWKFEEAATPWADAVLGKLIRSLIAPAGTSVVGGVAGRIQNGIEFSGVSGALNGAGNITTDPLAISYTAVKGCSFSVWLQILPTGTGTGVDCFFTLFDNINDSDITAEVLLGPGATTWHTSIDITDNLFNNYTKSVVAGTAIYGTWVCFVTTFDQTNGQVSFYFNGASIGSFTSTVFPNSMGQYGGTVTSQRQALDPNVRALLLVDEMGVWMNHVLTAGEVSALWNSGSGSRPLGV